MLENVELQEDPETGKLYLLLGFDESQEIDGQSIPLTCGASYSELLGHQNLVDTIEAVSEIIAAKAPLLDPETGSSVWEAPYAVLGVREQAREAAVIHEIESDAHNPRSLELTGALAAYAATRTASGDCAVRRVREATCDAIGIPKPVSQRGATGALVRLACDSRNYTDQPGRFTPEDRAKILAALQACPPPCEDPCWIEHEHRDGCCEGCTHDHLTDRLEYIRSADHAFCHSLSGHAVDPFAVVPEPAPAQEAIKARYGLAQEGHHAA